jgi:uncharacterized lipoprotein NlpE involved in copper resistance
VAWRCQWSSPFGPHGETVHTSQGPFRPENGAPGEVAHGPRPRYHCPVRVRRTLGGVLASALGLAGLAACGAPGPAPHASTPAPVASRPPAPDAAAVADRESEIGRWRGRLPCSDCAGIDTELTLYAAAGGVEGPFRLVEVHVGRRGGTVRRVESEGEWFAQRGDADDPEATVYRLEPSQGAPRRFLAVGDDLEALDHQGRRIRTRANLRLTLVADDSSAAADAPAAPPDETTAH